jgi:cell division protein FtsX
MCFSDFFPLFDVPFEYGNGWDRRADRAPEPVAVLGYKTNQKLFGGENSVGRSVRVEDRDFKVVGVLKTWRPLPKYYDPHNGRNVVVQTLEELKAKTYMPDVNVARILGAVIILLVFVTALGIVGMTSFSVTERTRQIGTRRAIGARRLDILRYFLTENWIITSLGVVLGVMLTYGFNYVLMNALNGTRLDWRLVIGGVVGMWLTSLTAAFFPALRGARVTPATATRTV